MAPASGDSQVRQMAIGAVSVAPSPVIMNIRSPQVSIASASSSSRTCWLSAAAA